MPAAVGPKIVAPPTSNRAYFTPEDPVTPDLYLPNSTLRTCGLGIPTSIVPHVADLGKTRPGPTQYQQVLRCRFFWVQPSPLWNQPAGRVQLQHVPSADQGFGARQRVLDLLAQPLRD